MFPCSVCRNNRSASTSTSNLCSPSPRYFSTRPGSAPHTNPSTLSPPSPELLQPPPRIGPPHHPLRHNRQLLFLILLLFFLTLNLSPTTIHPLRRRRRVERSRPPDVPPHVLNEVRVR